MRHTKEKLYIDGYGRVRANGADEFLGVCVDGFSLNASKESQENTRRIVACWNACEDITNESLDRGMGLDRACKLDMITARRERDELLAAIKEYLPFLPESTAKNGGAASYSSMLKASDNLKDVFKRVEADK